MLLENKIALVTGAASGIGAATARLFVEEGAQLVLTDVDTSACNALAAELGGAAEALCGDITDEDFVADLLDEVVARHGRLDCAVNNAGITGEPVSIDQMPLANWQQVIDVNLNGMFLCLKHELRHMKARGSGAIVNMASGAGVIAVPFMASYCASKHAVLGLTKTAASEVVREGIRVNAILPGSIHTPPLQRTMDASAEMEKMIRGSVPCGRFGEPIEVAQNCAWLCSDRASYVSGEAMAVDFATVCR